MAKRIKFWELPWDCQRWWTSPTRVQMSLAARGLYFEMLNYQWMEGGVPDDPVLVASLLSIPTSEVEAVWGCVRPRFGRRQGGPGKSIANKRMEQIRRLKLGTHTSRIASARKAANVKWSKQRSNDATAMQVNAPFNELERTKERKNERTNTPLPPSGRGVRVSPPDLTDHWLQLKAEYPKDTMLHARVTEDAWVQVVLDASDPVSAFQEVWDGLQRMKGSGTEIRFLPSLKDFLLNRRFTESWKRREQTLEEKWGDL